MNNPYPLYLPICSPFQPYSAPMYPIHFPQYTQYPQYPQYHRNSQYYQNGASQMNNTRMQNTNQRRNEVREEGTSNPNQENNNQRNNNRNRRNNVQENNQRRVQIPQVEIISRTIDTSNPSNNSVHNIELTPNILSSINNLTDELVSTLQFDVQTNIANENIPQRRITMNEIYNHTTLETYQNTSGETETCSICRQQLEDRQIIRKLRCNHKYHASCIDRWITSESEQNCNCPMCRISIIPSDT